MNGFNKQSALATKEESANAKAAIEMVDRVSNRIIDAAELRGKYSWQTVVVKSKVPNAFVLPNGKIVVFSGLLPVAKTEAGLAAVLGHEVAHVTARHGAERVSQVLLADIAVTAASVALVAANVQGGAAMGAALGVGAHFGVLLPYSRTHESEADRIGLIYMARAGYNPSEAIGLWQRMAAAGTGNSWEFLSTHPSPATRQVQIAEWEQEAMVYYRDPRRPLPTSITDLVAATAEHQRAAIRAPTADRPSLRAGSWFKVAGTDRPEPRLVRVQSERPCAEGMCLLIEREGIGESVLTRNLALVETRELSGQWRRYSPALVQYQWPLRVGNRWTQAVAMEDSTGRRESVHARFDVVGYETLTVPAGTFLAYRIALAMNGRRVSETWYAPEIGYVLRQVVYRSDGTVVTTDLVKYYLPTGD
jgi:hypothetical protein